MSIIDDVVEGLSKEVNKVQERSQEMFQSFSLSSQIRDLERKKHNKLKELGDLIVDKYHREKDISEEDIREKVAEVVGYEDQIDIIKAEIDSMNVQSDPNATSSQKAEAKAGFKPTPGFACPDCGTPASKDKKFCPACGGALHSGDDGPVDVEEAEEATSENGDKASKSDEEKKQDEGDDDDE